MGCAAATAKRRRKQAVGGYKHLPPMRRPHYLVQSREVSEKREAQAKATRIRMMQKRKRGK